jgi:hypothetical protein
MDHSRGNAIELIEGSQAAVNMTATANPLPIEYQWSKESTALGTHPYIKQPHLRGVGHKLATFSYFH